MLPKFMRPARRVIGCHAAALLFLCAQPTHAIVLGSSDTSPFSDFTSPYFGMSTAGVVPWNGSSAVAIGSRFLLTADHVGGSVGSSFSLNGATYTALSVATAPADAGSSLPVDLRIITLDRDLPSFYSIRSTPLLSNTPVIVAGFGDTGEDHGSYFTSSSSGRGTLRWGTNLVSYPAVRQSLNNHSSVTFSMKFDSGSTPLEAGFATGDSGGGSFVQAPDGSWQLAGINAYVATYNGIPGQFSQSFSISLAPHLDWITSITSVTPVPEPASFALLSLLSAPLAFRRRRTPR